MAHEIVTTTTGQVVEIDTDTKKCRKILHDLADLTIEDAVDAFSLNLKVYQRYLKDHFLGEECPIKKGKLLFRGFRIGCDSESGFTMIDTNGGAYAEVDAPFEGIPTPKELAAFFERKVVHHTADELAIAAERGRKQLEAERRRIEVLEGEPDFEVLRRKVIAKIDAINEGKSVKIDPVTIPDMIPFRRWKIAVGKLVRQWQEKKIRYPKLLSMVRSVTEEQDFETASDAKRYTFVGTLLPEFSSVGALTGDKIEVDGKLTDATKFLQDYLLHYEPKAMPRLMQYAKGEIDAVTLLRDPYTEDYEDYNSKLLPRNATSAAVLTALFASVGIEAPQDIYYDAEMKVGDKVLLWCDGEWRKKTVLRIEEDGGIYCCADYALRKIDKFIKLEA